MYNPTIGKLSGFRSAPSFRLNNKSVLFNRNHVNWNSFNRYRYITSPSHSVVLRCTSEDDSEFPETPDSKSDSSISDSSILDSISDIDTPRRLTIISNATSVTASSPASALSDPASQRLLNLFLLFSCFSYALYTVVTIDSETSRGWTLQESLYRMPYDNWRNYEDALELAPMETKTAINVVIYLLGDWLSQTIFKKEDPLKFDAMRTLKNGLIGACFGPAVHLYYEWSDFILPVEEGFNRLYKILMDQTLYLGVKCSIYIAAVGFLNGEGPAEVSGAVKDRIKPIMSTAWKFWPLVHCCTYSVIPARHRVLWVNCVDLFWNAILASLSRGGEGGDMIGEEVEER